MTLSLAVPLLLPPYSIASKQQHNPHPSIYSMPIPSGSIHTFFTQLILLIAPPSSLLPILLLLLHAMKTRKMYSFAIFYYKVQYGRSNGFFFDMCAITVVQCVV